jgi:protein MPE1
VNIFSPDLSFQPAHTVPRSASWHKQSVKSKGLSEVEVRERPSKDPSIVCPIDNRIFRDAVKTPCCGTAYCEDCIQTHLLEKDFICPSCASKVASLDKLAIDKPNAPKVADYISKEIEASQREEDTGKSRPRSVSN